MVASSDATLACAPLPCLPPKRHCCPEQFLVHSFYPRHPCEEPALDWIEGEGLSEKAGEKMDPRIRKEDGNRYPFLTIRHIQKC